MIPRYKPTFAYADLFKSLSRKGRREAGPQLVSGLAAIHNVKHVFLTKSGRAGIFAILKALDRPGKALMAAYNCIVVPEAVRYAGYEPAFLDIDRLSLNVTAPMIEGAFTPETTVVFVTHLFGVPCDLDAVLPFLRRRGVFILEDAAAAMGAEYDHRLVGTFGDAAVISFQYTKVISASSGGAILTNSDELAGRLERIFHEARASRRAIGPFLRSTAWKTLFRPAVYPTLRRADRLIRGDRMYETVAPLLEEPPNYFEKCAPFDCALIASQLRNLEGNLRRRRHIAEIYREILKDHPALQIPGIPDKSSPAWIQFPLVAPHKAGFYGFMQRNGIDLSWTYRYSCAEGFHQDGFPNARRAAETVLGLPTYPSLTDGEAERVGSAARRYAETRLP